MPELTEDAARDCLDYLKLVDAWLHEVGAPDEIFRRTITAEDCMSAMIGRLWPRPQPEVEFADDGSF